MLLKPIWAWKGSTLLCKLFIGLTLEHRTVVCCSEGQSCDHLEEN